MKPKIFNYNEEHGCINFASKYTGLSVSTIYKKAERGQIPYSRIPGSNKMVFFREELRQWMKKDSITILD